MAPHLIDNCPYDIEEAIAFLRQNGCSIIETIKYLKNERHLSLGEAKRRVHFSDTWTDVRADIDAFHTALEAAVRDIAAGENSGVLWDEED